MGTPINVIIDNKTVVDDLESIEISQQEGTYCNTVTLSLKNKNFWGLCDPTINFGVLRIKVIIGSDTYQFLIEERDSTPTIPGVSFTVWGRSKQALLSKPYSKTINDTDDTSHPWQTANTTAAAIVAYVISSAYCSYGVTVSWNVSDFAVYVDSFSVSNQSPIDVISSLAQVIGAELQVNVDGSLSVESYSVAEGSSVQSYNDLDDIVSLSESIDYPSGYNAVTVYGYGSTGSTNAYISAERVTEDDEDSTIYPDRNHTVRVYYYHSGGLTPTYSFPEGHCHFTRSGIESITEDVLLIFGRGSTSRTNTAGNTEVTGSESIPITTVSTTYNVNYRDSAVRGSDAETYSMLFYFTDKSAYTTYSFTVTDTDESCGDMVLEFTGDTEKTVDDVLVYNNYPFAGGAGFYAYDPYGNRYINWRQSIGVGGGGTGKVSLPGGSGSSMTVQDYSGLLGEVDRRIAAAANDSTPVVVNEKPIFRLYCTPGVTVTGTGTSVGGSLSYRKSSASSETEEITFINGQASVRYPINSGVVLSWYGVSGSVKWYKGFNTLIVADWVDNEDRYAVSATVTYTTYYKEYGFTVPNASPGSITVWASTACGIVSSSFSVGDGSGKRDVTINVKDYVSNADLDGAEIWVDNVYQGVVNSQGKLTVTQLNTGSHSIKITKSGYLDTDQDDLANSSFYIESE